MALDKRNIERFVIVGLFSLLGTGCAQQAEESRDSTHSYAPERLAGKGFLPISRHVTPGSGGIRRLKSVTKFRLLVHQGWAEQV